MDLELITLVEVVESVAEAILDTQVVTEVAEDIQIRVIMLITNKITSSILDSTYMEQARRDRTLPIERYWRTNY